MKQRLELGKAACARRVGIIGDEDEAQGVETGGILRGHLEMTDWKMAHFQAPPACLSLQRLAEFE